MKRAVGFKVLQPYGFRKRITFVPYNFVRLSFSIFMSNHAAGTNRVIHLYLVFTRGTLFIASFTQ